MLLLLCRLVVEKYSYCCSDASVFGCLLTMVAPTEGILLKNKRKEKESRRSCGWLVERGSVGNDKRVLFFLSYCLG